MPLNLQSKTVVGLLFLLAVVVYLDLIGHLTAEAVDAIKWLGASYMSVRTIANLPGNAPTPPPAPPHA